MNTTYSRADHQRGALAGALIGLLTMIAVLVLAASLAPAASAETSAQRCQRETAAYNAAWKAIGKKPPAPYKCGGSNTPPPTLSPAEPTTETPEKPGDPTTQAPENKSDGPNLNTPTERREIEHPTGGPRVEDPRRSSPNLTTRPNQVTPRVRMPRRESSDSTDKPIVNRKSADGPQVSVMAMKKGQTLGVPTCTIGIPSTSFCAFPGRQLVSKDDYSLGTPYYDSNNSFDRTIHCPEGTKMVTGPGIRNSTTWNTLNIPLSFDCVSPATSPKVIQDYENATVIQTCPGQPDTSDVVVGSMTGVTQTTTNTSSNTTSSTRSVDTKSGAFQAAIGGNTEVTNEISNATANTGQYTYQQWFRGMKVPEGTAKRWVPNAKVIQYTNVHVGEIDHAVLGWVISHTTEVVQVKYPTGGGVWQNVPFDPSKCGR